MRESTVRKNSVLEGMGFMFPVYDDETLAQVDTCECVETAWDFVHNSCVCKQCGIDKCYSSYTTESMKQGRMDKILVILVPQYYIYTQYV